jgi:hypothetical protein
MYRRITDRALIYAGIFMAVISVAVYLSGCSGKSPGYQYLCVTPTGPVRIANETDTGIKFDGQTVRASRDGMSIIIPFSQCVALKGPAQ